MFFYSYNFSLQWIVNGMNGRHGQHVVKIAVEEKNNALEPNVLQKMILGDALEIHLRKNHAIPMNAPVRLYSFIS